MPEAYRHCWRRFETSNEKPADLLYSRAKQRGGRSARSGVARHATPEQAAHRQRFYIYNRLNRNLGPIPFDTGLVDLALLGAKRPDSPP
jgi:hypothetical protein